MGKNSHEFFLSTTSCNVFTKNTRVSIVKLCQTFKHLDSFRARCQTLTWPPDCHTGVPERVFLVSWPFLIARRTAVLSSCMFFTWQWHKRFSRHEQELQWRTQWVERAECRAQCGDGARQGRHSPWAVCSIPCLGPGASSAMQGLALMCQEVWSGPLVMAQGLLLVTLSVAGPGTCFSKLPST